MTHDTPGRGPARVLQAVATALGAVIAAPIALSSQDLYRWAAAPRGLGLTWPWPLFVPIALDLAAAACIGMTVVAAWRRDRPGVFGLLVWVFAATSAYAQYEHGIAERDAGRAQDAWWAMPAFALLGPLLLEVTLHRLRRWLRADAREVLTGAAGFGVRWLVAPWSTLAAWAASRREGISDAWEAITWTRDRRTVRTLPQAEALAYALSVSGGRDLLAARRWLADRGVRVNQRAVDQVAATIPARTTTAPSPTPRAAGPTTTTGSTRPATTAGDDSTTRKARRQPPHVTDAVAKVLRRYPDETDTQLAARAGVTEVTIRRARARLTDTTPPQSPNNHASTGVTATPSTDPSPAPTRSRLAANSESTAGHELEPV
jgi:hypothetical protein